MNRMRYYHYTLFILFFSILFFNCTRNNIDASGNGASQVITTLQGRITDGTNPIAGAKVKLGFRTTTTNSDGFYKMDSAVLDKGVTVVNVEKDGYFNGTRTFSATPGTNEINISLFYKLLTGEFVNSTGGTLEVPNYCSVDFSANSIEKESGGSYSGAVKVFMVYLDPTKSYIPGFIPGSYLAKDKFNNRVTLVSYGMMGVELESPSGEKLRLAKQKTATITCAIPASLQNDAPATISLWHMDESIGLWKEEGTAVKVGSKYVGVVSHFSFWNCDVGLPLVNITATFKDQNGNFLSFKQIQLRTANYGARFATTDEFGQISGGVPVGTTIFIDLILPPCVAPFVVDTVGPFSSNTNLGTITVTLPQTKSVSGRLLNCSGNPVTNGYVIINYGPNAYFSNVNSNGDFSTELSICNTTSTTCQITGVDLNTQLQGSPTTVSVSGGTNNAGDIAACGVISATEYISYSINNSPLVTLNSTTSPGFHFSGSKTVINNDSVIYLVSTDGGPNGGIYITFKDNNSVAGPSPLIRVSIDDYFAFLAPAQPINVGLTTYATQVGEFYTGSFSGQVINSSTGVASPINCSFRMRRTR